MTDQAFLFDDLENEWEKEWHDMPEFNFENKEPFQQIIMSFKNFEDVKKFANLIGYKRVTPKTKSLWFPKPEIDAPKNYLWVDKDEK